MNVRIRLEPTPARRLAALLRGYLQKFLDPPPPTPDYADIGADIELYTTREELMARLSELQTTIDHLGINDYFRARIADLAEKAQENDAAIRDRGLLRDQDNGPFLLGQ